MARELFDLEVGLRISAENSQTDFVELFQGTVAPGGDAGVLDDAPIGSLYIRRNGSNSEVLQKYQDNDNTSDWQKISSDVTLDQLSWRNEKVRAATIDTVTAGTVDVTGFSDNESGLDGNDFAVGEYLIGDIDGTPALFEVTAVNSAIDITVAAATQAIADNDTFIIQKYLPDSPGNQEDQAIVHFPVAGSPGIKISDVNWNFADGIGIASGYAPGSGNISNADTVNSAIEKLDGNNDAQDLVLGTAQGAVDFGTFTGTLFDNNESAKDLFQRIEDLLEEIKVIETTGITTEVSVDEVPTANVSACKWLVEAFEEATPANKRAVEVYALNNGTVADDTQYAKLKVGANFNVSLSVDVSGGNMRLRAASSTAGITVRVRRLQVTNI